MKKALFGVCIALFGITTSVNAQTPLDNYITREPVTTLPNSYPKGVYLMNSESDSAWNWPMDAGTILGLKAMDTNSRHIQLLSNNLGTQFWLRSIDQGNNAWTGWRKILMDVDGNVGIGTTTPASKLDVDGGDVYIGSEVAANGTRRQLRIYGYDNNAQFYGRIHSNYDDVRRTFDISTNDATQQLKIDASANEDGKITLMPGTNVGVGIGTLTMGSHKLAVEGSIGAREVVVEATSWPDYVFHPDYELRSLSEIEAHIKAKGHLPEVPSARQVEEEGQHLGEMQQLLLKKIEELTLHTIEQQKLIQKQQQLLEEHASKIKQLENEN
ncbi:MAG: hypothetical protein ED557_12005 [Balneola sp.]|nr:MAG: hypothetical protein ED557_12005 [Balneola sp.]